MASSLINTANNPPWLEWMTTLMGEVSGGSASRHTYAATLPPDRFLIKKNKKKEKRKKNRKKRIRIRKGKK